MPEKTECKYCGKKFGSEAAMQQHIKHKHEDVQKEKFPKTGARKIKKIGIYLVAFLILAGIIYGLSVLSSQPKIGSAGSAHLHADIKVYVNGNQIDFSQPMYQLQSNLVHFEGGDGDVIHVHATGMTIGYALKTLGINFSPNCISVGNNNFCNGGTKTLKFYVNGRPNIVFGNYEIRNLDKILVSYGSENETAIQAQLDSITNKAVQSSSGAE